MQEFPDYASKDYASIITYQLVHDFLTAEHVQHLHAW